MKNYIEVVERNDWEGETWKFFVVEEGNEKFLEKLKKTIDKFEDEELEVTDKRVPENEVDILVKHTDSGYMDYFNKVDKKLDIKRIKSSSHDKFKQSFNKGSLFES